MKKPHRKKSYSQQELLNIYQFFDGNRTQAANYWGIPRQTVNNWFLKLEKTTEFKKRLERVQNQLKNVKPTSTLTVSKTKKRYVITSEINDTPLHKNFLKSLLNYCDYKNAQLIVIPIRYKNPNSYTPLSEYTPTWSKELERYRLTTDLILNDNCVILASYHAQATARNPVQRKIGSLGKGKSVVIGHPQISLHMTPTPFVDLPRQLISTGSVSERNYSNSVIGSYATHDHSFGATLVEIIDEKFFNTRVLEASEDGSFYDVDMKSKSIAKYSPEGVEIGFRAKTLACGDLHAYHLDENVKNCTWLDKNSIVNICKPENQIIHDAYDQYSQNHHHKNDIHIKIRKVRENRWKVEDELTQLLNLHNEIFTDKKCQYHYIASNHNDSLVKWLKETDWRFDPHNAEIYLRLNLLMLENNFQHPLYLWMKDKIKNPKNTFFHTKNSKLLIGNVDYGQHGDKGPNGVKGTPNSFVTASVSVTTAHTHTPMVKQGVHVCGTSSKLNLGYNDGYSSWIHCHNLQYPNGKRTPLFIIRDFWIMEE